MFPRTPFTPLSFGRGSDGPSAWPIGVTSRVARGASKLVGNRPANRAGNSAVARGDWWGVGGTRRGGAGWAPGREDPGSTRGRLLRAAFAVLVRDGYHATTVQAVAREAGLSSGAIYGNFTDKQELMALAVLERWSELQHDLFSLAGGLVLGGGRETGVLLHHFVEHLAAPPSSEHRLLTEVTGAAMRDAGPSPLQEGAETLASVVRGAVENGKAAGVISEAFTTDALVALMVCLHLGTITSKSWGLRQVSPDEARQVLAALSRSIAPGRPRP